MTVYSIAPKTERHPNGSQRLIPMFKELVQPLKDAWRERPEGAVYVISKHRSQADVSDSWADSNLREPMLDILKRAGIKSWPKLFHAMRAACETDLVRSGYQLKDVTSWMGHSHEVAEKHYLRVREEEFDRAVEFGAVRIVDDVPKVDPNMQNMEENDFLSPEKMVQKAVLQASARSCRKTTQQTKVPQFTGFCNSVQPCATGLIAKAGLDV